MRVLAVLLISALFLAWTPRLSLAEEAPPAAVEAPAAHEHTMAPATDAAPSSVTLQEVVIGTAVLGSAFAVGILAGGSLSTGLAAASAVVLVYTFMP